MKTAKELATLTPYGVATRLLVKAEMELLQRELKGEVYRLARLKWKEECFDAIRIVEIIDEKITWETYEECDLCDGSGIIWSSKTSREYNCPACDGYDDGDSFEFMTNLDGDNLEMVA